MANTPQVFPEVIRVPTVVQLAEFSATENAWLLITGASLRLVSGTVIVAGLFIFPVPLS
jgi:hypothetical protein